MLRTVMASLHVQAAAQPMTREELNKTAHALVSRAQLVAASRGSRDVEAVTELRTDCQSIRAEIQQLRRQCAQLAEPPATTHDKDSTVYLLLEETRLKAELEVLHREKVEVISTREEVAQSETYQQLSESSVQLHQLLAVLKNERMTVQNELKSEQVLLKETQELEAALEKKLTVTLSRTAQRESSGAEVDLGERLTHAEETSKSLRENLVQFTTEEIIQPSDDIEKGGGRERGRGQARLDTMLVRGGNEQNNAMFPPLADVVQNLISQTLSSPHSPYLPLATIWPPHSNLLMRSGVIQRHPDNPGLVRVTPFHL